MFKKLQIYTHLLMGQMFLFAIMRIVKTESESAKAFYDWLNRELEF